MTDAGVPVHVLRKIAGHAVAHHDAALPDLSRCRLDRGRTSAATSALVAGYPGGQPARERFFLIGGDASGDGNSGEHFGVNADWPCVGLPGNVAAYG
jgi:hypothetical protein